MNKRARILVDSDVLVEALHLPARTRITGMSFDHSREWPPLIELAVEGDAFPHVEDGATPPIVMPVLHRAECGCISLVDLHVSSHG